MCGFVGTEADNSEAESRFEELVRAHTFQPAGGMSQVRYQDLANAYVSS